jgi:hypothetical protein
VTSSSSTGEAPPKSVAEIILKQNETQSQQFLFQARNYTKFDILTAVKMSVLVV